MANVTAIRDNRKSASDYTYTTGQSYTAIPNLPKTTGTIWPSRGRNTGK